MKAKGMTQQTTQYEVGEKSVSTAYREMLIVIRREVLTRTKNKTILLATGLLALTVGIGAGVGGWFLGEKMGDASFQLDTRLLFATAMVSALLSSLVYSSQSLTSGVVEEKSSRVVEILLTKIGVVPLLAGKMIGIGAITLVQLLLIGGTGLLGFTLVDGWSLLELEVGAALLWFLVWFLLGYIIFATMNTILASTVSRQEDLSAAVMPLSVLQMVLLVIALYLTPTYLEEAWLKGLSFVPLFSSYLMPIRFGLDGVQTWEMVTAASIAGVTITLLFWVATRVYSNNALRTGSKVSLQQSFASDNGA